MYIYTCQQAHPIILHSIECEPRVPLILSCQEYVCGVKDQLVSRTGDLAEQTRDRIDILEQRLRSWQVRNVHFCDVYVHSHGGGLVQNKILPF